MDINSEEAQAARDFAAKLVACSADLAHLSKDGTNAHFKYRFVSEAQVKAAVKPVLIKHGLAIMQVTVSMTPDSKPSSACVKVTVVIGDGVHIATFEGIGAGTDSGDKAPMKATAAALKYALTSAFIIPTNDDPEADPETDAPKAPKRVAARAAKSPAAVVGAELRAALDKVADGRFAGSGRAAPTKQQDADDGSW